jgi:hypothetical protein
MDYSWFLFFFLIPVTADPCMYFIQDKIYIREIKLFRDMEKTEMESSGIKNMTVQGVISTPFQ